MAYIGKVPTSVPLTSSDITDGIISVAKLSSTLDLSSNTVTLPSGVGGKVLQVVNQEEQTSYVSNSSSASDTGIGLSITPSATNSKILLTTNFSLRTAGNTYCSFYVYRQINSGGYSEFDRLDSAIHYYMNAEIQTKYFGQKLDTTHNTTNQIDYKIYAHVQGGGGNLSLIVDNTSELGNITAMEISA